MRWFVRVTTETGCMMFPFQSGSGYRSENEAKFVAEECMKNVPGVLSAEVVKEGLE